MTENVFCNYCGEKAELLTGEEVYSHRKDLAELLFYCCENCDARVGCHKGTKLPKGPLANRKLRFFRVTAHKLFDPIWERGDMTRSEAYLWLSEKMKIDKDRCHIGMFGIKSCQQVIDICHAYMDEKFEVDISGLSELFGQDK